VITGVALLLPYTGFVSIVRNDICLTAPPRVVVPKGKEVAEITMQIRNSGNLPAQVIAAVSWCDFLTEIRSPSGFTLRRRPQPFLRLLQRSRADYRAVPPNSSQPFCQLRFRPGEVLGTPADWTSTAAEALAPSRLPFAERGAYRVKLTYCDKAGAQHGALSGLSQVEFTLVLE
jgi:hypothetical protein